MKSLIFIITLAALLSVSGCTTTKNSSNGMADNMGNAVKDAGNAAGNAVEKTGDAVKDVGDGVVNGVEDVGEGVKDGIDKMTDNNKNQ